ncbi:hypothetical protein AUR67_00530 [Pseudoalteromonas sp. XI10]|uniref:hypothetical protein n=1 Tax=Pseudoalteromonas sp. XI10 TaxID=1766621 RepID=UPI0007337610|nr:hypothetical protein [Pseudoalteromonas sp. XI10]KTG21998.1 hypothetical protein AUR67_00530 [Pseudoalteromonas sp. XI10]
MAEKKRTSLFTYLVLAGVIGAVYLSTQQPQEPVQLAPVKASQFQTIMQQLSMTFDQSTLDNGQLQVQFTLNNNSANTIANIEFRCTEFDSSNKWLTRYVQIEPSALLPNSTGEYTHIMGLSHPSAHATQCVVMDFKYN